MPGEGRSYLYVHPPYLAVMRLCGASSSNPILSRSFSYCNTSRSMYCSTQVGGRFPLSRKRKTPAKRGIGPNIDPSGVPLPRVYGAFWCKPATRPSLGGPGARGGAGERNAPPGLRGARPTVELEGGGVEAPSGLRGTLGGPFLNIAPPRQS